MAVSSARRQPKRGDAIVVIDKDLSEYERKRRARVAANELFMKQLGINHAQQQLKQHVTSTAAQKRKKPTKPKKAAASREPLRRSTRVHKLPLLAAKAEREQRLIEKKQQELMLAEAKKRRNRVRRRKIRVAAEAAAAERARRAKNRAAHEL